MCTAVSCVLSSHYFGRNLDLDYHYNEAVVITPRDFDMPFKFVPPPARGYAIIGIATVMDNYPLYYEAMNEKGLCIAGLNFPGNAVYNDLQVEKDNIAPFELIPWLLRQCETVAQAREQLGKIKLCSTPFREDLPLTPLHWLIADRDEAITIEPTSDGLRIMSNRARILTNNPPFEYHNYNLANFLNLTPQEPVNRFTSKLQLEPYSLGMGAIGLPGDFSSASRFVRCAFVKENSRFGETTHSQIGQMFHILSSVAQFDGCVQTPNGFEKTLYSSCCDADCGVFYYTTYSNRQITSIDMHNEELSGRELITYPLLTEQNIYYQNQK